VGIGTLQQQPSHHTHIGKTVLKQQQQHQQEPSPFFSGNI